MLWAFVPVRGFQVVVNPQRPRAEPLFHLRCSDGAHFHLPFHRSQTRAG